MASGMPDTRPDYGSSQQAGVAKVVGRGGVHSPCPSTRYITDEKRMIEIAWAQQRTRSFDGTVALAAHGR